MDQLRVNRPFDSADSPIDMAISASLKPLGKNIVFIMADVLPGLPKEIQRLVQTAGLIGKLIDRRMVLQVLAVFNRRLPDLIDRGIYPVNGCDFVLSLYPVTGTMLDHPPRSTQVGKRMQIVRMRAKGIQFAGSIGPGCSKEPQKQYRTHAEETLGLHLHFHEKEILSYKMIPVVRTSFHPKN